MNNSNVRKWYKDDVLYAEWSDLSLDDDDRDEYGIKIVVNTEAVDEYDKFAEKTLNTKLVIAYDQWIMETLN